MYTNLNVEISNELAINLYQDLIEWKKGFENAPYDILLEERLKMKKYRFFQES